MFETELNWVLSVVESCDTEPQLHNSGNLFKNLINKWDYQLSYEEKNKVFDYFLDKRIEKIEELRKNIAID
jgi:hypothetical protein